MKLLKRSRKGLMLDETIFIYCQRHNLQIDTFIDDVFISDEFLNDSNSEFDDIGEDLRRYGYHKNYKLKTITKEEYESCVDYIENN